MTDFNKVFDKFKKEDSSIEDFGKILGKGAYGEVREVKLKNIVKIMAAKLIKKEKDGETKEIIITQDSKGFNIIKINKYESTEIYGIQYDLIITEKTILRNLGKLIEFHYNHNLLKIINRPFLENIGNNLLRFYSKQIIDGLETLNRHKFIHFDIKPENLLVTSNLGIEMSHFSLITKVKDDDNVLKIQRGIFGYLTPEFYSKEKFSSIVDIKQSYFSLGSTLLFILYDDTLLKDPVFRQITLKADQIIDLIEVRNYEEKSGQKAELNKIDFLKSLIDQNAEEREISETIYKNKWINKNKEKIEEIFNSNENDEEKVMMELQKSDFLIVKKPKALKEKKFKFKRKKK